MWPRFIAKVSNLQSNVVRPGPHRRPQMTIWIASGSALSRSFAPIGESEQERERESERERVRERERERERKQPGLSGLIEPYQHSSITQYNTREPPAITSWQSGDDHCFDPLSTKRGETRENRLHDKNYETRAVNFFTQSQIPQCKKNLSV